MNQRRVGSTRGVFQLNPCVEHETEVTSWKRNEEGHGTASGVKDIFVDADLGG